MRHDESRVGYEDLAVDSRCFTVRRDDSSGNVRRPCAHCTGSLPASRIAASPEVPATSEEALRQAVKLAVDAGEYERAAGVLDVLRRTARSVGLGRDGETSIRDDESTRGCNGLGDQTYAVNGTKRCPREAARAVAEAQAHGTVARARLAT